MSLNVLVVDNNPVLQKALSGLLEKEGCRVATADDGLQALEAMKIVVPDLLFTDLVMPLVDGEQLCNIVKNTPAYQSIFVVVVSAILFEENQTHLDRIPSDIFISKGNLAEMKSHIKKALELYHHKGRKRSEILGGPSSGGLEQTITTEILQEKTHREEIVACLSEGVIELNEHGKIVEINRAALSILELSEAEVIGSTIDSLGWGKKKNQIAQWLKSNLLAKQMHPLEFAENNPIVRGGKVLTASFNAVSETTFFGLVILSDITRQHRAEKYNRELEHSLRLLKKMEAMSSMAGGMAHDFNNLLSVICGNLDMLAMSGRSINTERYELLLNQARNSAASAVDLVRKISHFSPYGIISRGDRYLKELVKSAIETFYFTRPVSIEQIGNGMVSSVSVDYEQIIVVLHNIMSNALEAGCSKISIAISEDEVEESIVEAGQYVPAGNYAKICLKDDGKGIDPRNITKIFDPYYSTKARSNMKGMGFGLTVSYATIRNHGGYFLVNSKLGAFTEVSIYLPLNSRTFTKNAAKWVSDDVGGEHVLIMEEDEQSRNVATLMLEFLGFEVLALAEKKNVLSLLQQHINAGHTFACAIIGVNPRKSHQAIKLCRQIHELVGDLDIIALCSSVNEEIANDYQSFGFGAIMSKPFTIDDLRAAVG
ncbi:MAG: response regulator [Desulfobulbaceae bacterium]|nr:MAG: response regulator [Desulfobulbaceae bacterium]